MIENHTVMLSDILKTVLQHNDQFNIENIEQNIYLNERTIEIVTENQLNLKKDLGYLIQLNTIGLKKLLDDYENDNTSSNNVIKYNNNTFTFNNQEEVRHLLERLLNCVLQKSLVDNGYKIKLFVHQSLLKSFSIRAIFDLTNPNINSEEYQNNKNRFNIFWYHLMCNLPINMNQYQHKFMTYVIQHDELFNVQALKNKKFCTLLLSFQFNTLLSPFEFDPREKLLQKITMMIVQYKNPKLLQYIITNKDHVEKMKRIAEATRFSSFDDRFWYYNIILDYEKKYI